MNSVANKHFRILISLILFSQTSIAQIFETRYEIIKERGYDYKTGITDNGVKYIYYEKQITTSSSGTFTQRKAYYFTILDNGIEVCFVWKVFEPSSETNVNVAYYKSNFVEIGYMRYKDFEIDIIYDIKVKDGLCIITVYLDNKK